MMDDGRRRRLKAIIESVLYASDKPVDIKTLMHAVGTTSKELVRKLIEEISAEYESNHPFRIKKLEDGRYFMSLEQEYSDMVRRYIKKPLLTLALMKTLSFIAYHQPVSQSAVAAVRGKEAYRHVKQLIERGLVEAEKSGRTLVLRTTQLFADYFNLRNSPSEIRKYIQRLMEGEKS